MRRGMQWKRRVRRVLPSSLAVSKLPLGCGVRLSLRPKNSHNFLTFAASMYSVAICGGYIDDPTRTQEGYGGGADPLADRSPSAARLRNRQIDRGTLGRRARVSCRLSLPHALSARKAWLDRRPLAGKGRAAAAPLLPVDGDGP